MMNHVKAIALAGLMSAILSGTCAAQTVLASRTIRSQTLLQLSDLVLAPDTLAGGVRDPNTLVGLETRVALYAGRPIMLADLGPPAVVTRNQIVLLVFRRGALSISTDGRALDRASIGDRVRVINLNSRTTIIGTVVAPGIVEVTG